MDKETFEELKMIFVEMIYSAELARTPESERDSCVATIRLIRFEAAMKRVSGGKDKG